MFNQGQQNAVAVTANIQQALIALRSAVNDAVNVCQWPVAQTAADLEAIGFSTADATLMQQVCGDIVSLLAMANGGPAAPVKNYLAEAMPLIGPNR